MKDLTKFDIRQTNITKGIAVLMLLWHHLFYNNPKTFDRFTSLYTFSNGVPAEVYISVFCKLCVAIFVFLSGYGLYCSFNKYLQKNLGEGTKYLIFSFKYTVKHLIKLLSDYWFIFIIFVPLGFWLGRNPIDIYAGSIKYAIIDFFGLSDFFFGTNAYTMNATWWFMSLIIILYIIFPIIYWLLEKNQLLVLALSLFATFIPNIWDNASVRIYVLAYVLGMIFAKNDLFKYIENFAKNHNYIVTSIAIFIIVCVSFLFRQKYLFENNKFDGILCIPVILFAFLVISRIKLVDKVFEILGKYSSGIFMFHTFIFSYYFKSFIYSFKYSVLIFVVLTVICLVIAIALEWIKNIIGYNKLFNFLTKKIIKQ